MPRKPEIDRPTHLHLSLPTTLRARLDVHLFSELEKRVPKGAYQGFFIERTREFFEHRQLDLAPFIVNAEPGAFVIQGSPAALEALVRRLKAT